MDSKTLKALKASIAKWEKNVEAETPDDVKLGAQNCPLCALFNGNDCEGCPVAERAGAEFCDNTPYSGASIEAVNWEYRGSSREDFQTAARAEVDFLKSLLPVEA